MHQVQFPNSTNDKFLFLAYFFDEKIYLTRPYLSYKGTFFQLRLYWIDLVVSMYVYSKNKKSESWKIGTTYFLR